MSILTNLKYFWKLDESSGNAADASGNANTLTNNNSVAYGAGKLNNCADFSSSNTNKSLSSSADIGVNYSSDFTMSVWANVTTAPGANSEKSIFWIEKGINDANDFFGVIDYQDISGTKSIVYGSAGTVTAGSHTYVTTLTPGTWYHLVITHTATTDTLYINGASVATATLGSNNNTGVQSSVQILGTNNANNRFFSGKVDEAGFWTRALTAGEVSQLYGAGAALPYPFVGGGSFFAFF